MDPITALGLLGSLCSLIEASNSLRKAIKSLKEAEKEVLELFNDVLIFEEALKGFDRVLRGGGAIHKISDKVINIALQEAYATIQNLETQLGRISKHDVPAMRRIKWVQSKSTLQRLHGRLKEQSAMLNTFIALANVETFLAVCSQYPQFLQLSLTVTDDIDSDGMSLQYETATLLSGSPTSSLDRMSVDTASLSAGSAASSLRRISFDSSSTSPLIQVVEDDITYEVDKKTKTKTCSQVASTPRRACRYDCYCICHTQGTGVSTKAISKVSGLQNQCTEPSCQGARMPKETAVIPSFFRRAISEVMSSRSIKVRYHLNTYRMVSEGSDALRYVKHGNLEKLKLCIQTGDATLWDTAPDGWSLLHTAVYNRQLPIVRYLLELGVDMEVADIGARKPADLAILKSFAVGATQVEQEIVKVFSRKDDYISDFEFTPIHIAVLNIYDSTDEERPSLEKLIKVLDDANNAPPGTDWAKWKLEYRKKSPLFGQIIELFRSSAAGRPNTHKVIHNLLDQKDRKYCWTPLHWACSAGRTDKMKILIDHGANPFILSNLDANILHAAVESKALNGLVGALEIWKRHPQQLNINQANRWAETPLHMAARESVGCVKLLLEAGADPNILQEDKQVALHSAGLSARGAARREIVALLCGRNDSPHINAQDVDGRPPIFDFLDDPECMKLLIDHGAKLNLLDNSGKSLFHHACIQDERVALNMLLRLSPDTAMVTVKDHDGNSPLIQALRHGSIDSAMTILKLDDVGDIVGQDGWTAAHYAAKLGDVDVLEAVLKHPSFVKGMKTIDGKTADVVAMEAGKWCGEVKKLLRRYNSIT